MPAARLTYSGQGQQQEGQGRAWYPVWNSGSGYALGTQVGAELTMMENRFVPARFKDGYGPVGAWFLFFKAKSTNAYGEDYCTGENFEATKKLYSPYAEKMGNSNQKPHDDDGHEGRQRPDSHANCSGDGRAWKGNGCKADKAP